MSNDYGLLHYPLPKRLAGCLHGAAFNKLSGGRARGKRGNTPSVLAPAPVMGVDLKSKVFRSAKALSVLDFRRICSWQYSTVHISTVWMGTVCLATLKSFIKTETESVLSTVEGNGECVVAWKKQFAVDQILDHLVTDHKGIKKWNSMLMRFPYPTEVRIKALYCSHRPHPSNYKCFSGGGNMRRDLLCLNCFPPS